MIRSPRVAKRIEGHYGITANCQRQHKLARCRELLAQTEPATTSEPIATLGQVSTDVSDSNAAHCPRCGGRMCVIEIMAPTATPHDTS